MQTSPISPGQTSPTALSTAGGVAAATAALNDPQAGLTDQLKAYQSLAGRWREAAPAARANLAQTLTETPFAQRVHATLNAFTRAAWAGADAVPPAPQVQMLKAFDGLSDDDRQIVAAMQADGSGAPAYRSAADYRARLKADADAAQAAVVEPTRSADSVTLSPAAQAHLAGGGAQGSSRDASAEAEASVHPEVAAALAAYTKAAR